MSRSNRTRLYLGLVVGLGIFLCAVAAILFSRYNDGADEPETASTLRVLSYSSFVHAWGPGLEIARRFEQRYGIHVELLEAGDAALMLKKLELWTADVVVGLDQLTLLEATRRKWKAIPYLPEHADLPWRRPEYLPFDWGPMTFIYKRNEIKPPESLDDLLDERFRGAIALQDPRTSTPGLQFLYWVLEEKGENRGFEYLKRLKTNLHTVSGSWSAAYGLFTRGHAKLVFSYLTSPVYHWIEENDHNFQPAVFTASRHPVQVEYAGIPDNCRHCHGAELFVQFLLEPEIQTLIMRRNFMMPIVSSVTQGTEFENLPRVKIKESPLGYGLPSDREEILRRWQELGL